MPPKKKPKIQIMNLHKCKPVERWDVIVDRSSELGNPYPMQSEEERDEVCDKYQERFDRIIQLQREKTPKRFHVGIYRELFNIVNIYKHYDRVRLFCWCSPKRCHADTIKKYLEGIKLK